MSKTTPETQNPSTALAVVADELAKVTEAFNPLALEKLPHIQRSFELAVGIKAIRTLMRKAVPVLRDLQGSELGFRTDKDATGGYSEEVIAECATEAVLRGLQLVGNEFNIIASRMYAAKNGCRGLVSRWPGLTDLELNPGVPRMLEGGAVVKYSASWKIEGKAFTMTRELPVRLNNGMGVDAVMGKAARKMLAAIYERISGSTISEGDAEDAPPAVPAAVPTPPALPEPKGRAESLVEKLTGKKNGATVVEEVREVGTEG